MTREKFETYETIRRSGLTNMFDVETVCFLSGYILTKNDCLDIFKNYDYYYDRYFKEEN